MQLGGELWMLLKAENDAAGLVLGFLILQNVVFLMTQQEPTLHGIHPDRPALTALA